jgi:glycosyltransferase involved in cell wall biosynthesis
MRKVKKIAILALGDAGWQGGIQYTTNLLNALDKVENNSEIEIHLFKKESQIFPDLADFTTLKIIVHPIENAFRTNILLKKLWWKLNETIFNDYHLRFVDYFLQNNFDFVFPSNIPSKYQKINVASWIADFQYHHFPNGASKTVTQKAEKLISLIAENSKKIILSSFFCEKDCHRLFPNTIGNTYVMPFSVYINPQNLSESNLDWVVKKYDLPEKFFIVSNLFAPTKNHKVIFEAMGLLKKKGTIINLVCTGNIVDYRNESYANEILQMLTDYKIRSQVFLLGLIPRLDQLALYRKSTAMIQPSLNEGWSTSVEEAKALGKDILTSDIEVHKEQIIDNPFEFISNNSEDLAFKIERIVQHTKDVTFPDIQREKIASESYHENVKKFGRLFLEIANI